MFNWKKLIFGLAVCLLFVPMVYLGVNTFFPDFDTHNTCYDKTRIDDCFRFDINTTQYQSCIGERDLDTAEKNECVRKYEKERAKHQGGKYITIMIISILASFLMLISSLDRSIVYGLFFGIVITAFTGTIAYIDSKSMIGFILLVVLFIIIIFFIQRHKSSN